MEEKELEEDDDDDDDVVGITAVQFFGMLNEAFIGKEMENRKKEEEEGEKRKGNDDDGGKKSGGGANRGKKIRGVIGSSTSKGDNENNAESWDEHAFDVGGDEGAEWETTKGTRTTTKRVRRMRIRKKTGGGSAAAENAK